MYRKFLLNRHFKSRSFLISFVFLALFVLWTLIVCLVDVRPIGPRGSEVGLAGLNGRFRSLVGVNLTLYTLTDWLSLVAAAVCIGFAILGLVQLITRRSIRCVDKDIFVLGGFYILTIMAYLFFESCAVNYRPVLINGRLEASYPSSTTLLIACVMPSAMLQLNKRIRNRLFRSAALSVIAVFCLFMIVGRVVSGVHWISDIIGGIFLSTGLVMLYHAVCQWICGFGNESKRSPGSCAPKR